MRVILRVGSGYEPDGGVEFFVLAVAGMHVTMSVLGFDVGGTGMQDSMVVVNGRLAGLEPSMNLIDGISRPL